MKAADPNGCWACRPYLVVAVLLFAATLKVHASTPAGRILGQRHSQEVSRALQQVAGGVVAWGDAVMPLYVPPQANSVGVKAAAITIDKNYGAWLKDNSILVWGDNQTVHTPAVASSGVTGITASGQQLLAVVNGSVVPLLGWPSFTVPAAVQSGVQSITCGNSQAQSRCAAIKVLGGVIVWDADSSGKVTEVHDIQVDQAAADEVVLLRAVNGSVVVLNGTSANQLPVPQAAQQNVTRIAVWHRTCFAALANGSVLQWEAGNSTALFAPVPAVPGVRSLSAGWQCGFFWGYTSAYAYAANVVMANGTVIMYPVGPLGGRSNVVYSGPQDAPMDGALALVVGADVLSVAPDYVDGSAGACFTIQDGGALQGWGGLWNPVADAMALPSGVVEIAAGDNFMLALLQDGTVTSLGANSAGQRDVPYFYGRRPRSISAGGEYAFVVFDDGGVEAWGGGNLSSTVRADARARAGVSKVAVGNTVCAVLKAREAGEGPILVWADDGSTYQEFQGPFSDVAVGGDRVVGVLPNGSLVFLWPQPSMVPDRAFNHDVRTVSLGSDVCMALRTDDTTFPCRCLTMDCPPGMPEGYTPGGAHFNYSMEGVAAVSVGADNHVVFLMNNGSVLCDIAGTYTAGVDTWRLGNGCKVPPELRSAAPGKVLDVVSGLRFSVALVSVPGPPAPHPPTPPSASPAAPGSLSPSAPPDSSTLPAPPAPASLLPPSSQSTSPPSPQGLSAGALAGIIGGALLAMAAVLAITWYLIRRRGASRLKHGPFLLPSSKTHGADAASEEWWQQFKPPTLHLPGLASRDVFLLATAFQYSWVEHSPAKAQAMEAFSPNTQAAQQDSSCGAIQLSKSELSQQVQLVKDGLLGRGATALVFKGLWPARFGPNALLAVKVLHDGFTADPLTLESFTYEAGVLASTDHPNVVKLYGYCLELPTVCLILELLPGSLKDRLYRSLPTPSTAGTSTTRSQVTTAQSPSTAHASAAAGSSGTSYTAASTHSALPVGHSSGTAAATQPRNVPLAGASQLQPGSSHTSDGTAITSGTFGASAGPLSVLETVRISADIAAGLAYLHGSNTPCAVPAGPHSMLRTVEESEHTACEISLGAPAGSIGSQAAGTKANKIVHRDLKPANILLNSQGVAKISDFGLAREHLTTTVATMHLGAGTLAYMAPELLAAAQVRAITSATNKVDLYSLGMMMWEMQAGQPPWSGLAQAAIMAAVLNKRRPPLPQSSVEDLQDMPAAASGNVAPFLAPGPAASAEAAGQQRLNAIISACWAHREQRRPTASEVHSMLLALQQHLQQLDSEQGSSTCTTAT